MMSRSEHDIEQLNSLIELTFDNGREYEDAANAARDRGISTMIRERAGERRFVVQYLQTAVRDLGGKARDEGTVLAAAYRSLMRIKNSLAGNDFTIVAHLESSENRVAENFETLLRDPGVSETARAAIARAYRTIVRGHERMHDLWDYTGQHKAG
jgi:uncharacterized protein (TIGR02284 family)